MTQVAVRPDVVIQAEALGGVRVRCRLLGRSHLLMTVAGPVATAVPIVVVWTSSLDKRRRPRARAKRLAQRLRAWGFRRVRIERGRKGNRT